MLILDSKRKKAENATWSKSISDISPMPLYQILPPGSCSVSISALTSLSGYVNQINALLPRLLLAVVFGHSNSSPKTSSKEDASCVVMLCIHLT